MQIKKHWLLLASLILSLLILSIGQTSYNQKTEESKNQTIEEQKNLENKKSSNQEQNHEETKKSENSLATNKSEMTQKTNDQTDKLISTTTTDTNSVANSNATINDQETKQYVNFFIESIGNFQVEYKEGDTGWIAMQRAASNHQFNIKYQIYDFGIYIRSIANCEPTGNSYWSLYHNGAYSMIGIRDLVVKPNDTITWKIETW